MPYIYDLAEPQELIQFVRELEFPRFTLDQFLPNIKIDDIEYAFNRNTLEDQDVAPYRSWDSEAAIGKRQGLARVRGEIPPLSKKIRLGEEERLRRRALETGNDDAIIDAIFADAENMTRAVQARIEKARGQLLYTGTVTLAENNLAMEADFGVPAEHFVAPAGLAWSDPDSDIIGDLMAWAATYGITTGGEVPGVLVISTRIKGYMLKNNGVKAAGIPSASLVSGAPNIVTENVLGAVLNAFGLPTVLVYDTTVRVDGVTTRVIPDDRLIMLPSADAMGELGATFYGTTAEALVLRRDGQIEAEDAPGVVAVVSDEYDPVGTWTKAAAIALPTLANPELLLVADVA